MRLDVERLRWPRSAVQAKQHAVVTVLWIGALVITCAGPSQRSIAGPLKGADFVHFYTLGHLARSQRTDIIYDMRALHDEQVSLVPESAPEIYPSVYPPQAAALFAPFSRWSYKTALLAWSLVTIVLYALIVWSAWRRVCAQLPDRGLMLAAAAGFMPFWNLVLNGQMSIVILFAFWLGWLALERNRSFLAGAAFGLLALKPQFGIPLAAIVLACGEWRILVGALTSVIAQSAVVWLMLGSSVFYDFAASIPSTATYAEVLEAKPFNSHSLRAVTRLLPNAIGTPLWLALSALVLWYTVRVWKSDAPVRVRVGIVILASLLVNPHVIVYDVTLLALPLIWFGAYMLEPQRQEHAPTGSQILFWDRIVVPLSRLIDPVLTRKVGKSVVAIWTLPA